MDLDHDPDPGSETAAMVSELTRLAQRRGVWSDSPNAEVIAYVSSTGNPMPTNDRGTLARYVFSAEHSQPGWWFVTWRWRTVSYRSDQNPADDLLDRTREVHERFDEFLREMLDHQDGPPQPTRLELVQSKLLEDLTALVYEHEPDLRKLLRFLSNGDEEETDRRFAYLSSQIDAFRLGDRERDPLYKRIWVRAGVLGTTAALGFIGAGGGATAGYVIEQFDPRAQDRITATADNLAELREICGLDDSDPAAAGHPSPSP
jgi:hypothetical protein